MQKKLKRRHVYNNVKNLDLIHARLGHVSLSKMQHLVFCDCKGLTSFFAQLLNIIGCLLSQVNQLQNIFFT